MQAEIIGAVLEGKDTLALLPTGGGKSICYQVPALLHPGLTIVVTPLVALMQEQVEKLQSLDISATHISAGMNRGDVYRELNNAAEGAYKLLYISPERIQTELFREFLPVLNLSLIAVDEAHCVSQWGHDFRPDYLEVKILRRAFPKAPILAVTASATPEVQADIMKQLEMSNPQLFIQSFERTNLHYTIQYSEQKDRDVIAWLSKIPGNAIIYCRSRKKTELLSRQLGQNKISALAYHAGMSHEQRINNREQWMGNKAPVMVATTAFGMGIDKPDVRLVLHYDVPEHLEAYYQESGRAGRDGLPAQSMLLYNHSDIIGLQESTETQFPPYPFIRKVYQSVAEYLQIPTGTEPYRYYDFDLADFCKKFKLPALPAARALRLLEQEGLWTLSEAVFAPATVHILAERQELDNLSRLYPDMNLLITTMLRLYSGLFYHPTTINVKLIAKHLKIKSVLVTQMLEQLDKMELIQFNQPKDGPQLFFHHYRVDSQGLIINTARINALKKTHRQRTEAMIRFISGNEVCRTRIMLPYFGQEYDKDCGHCDVCSGRKGVTASLQEVRRAVELVLKNSAEIRTDELVRSLPQYPSEVITNAIRSIIDEGHYGLKGNGVIYHK